MNPERSVGTDPIGPHGKKLGFYFYIMKICREILRKE